MATHHVQIHKSVLGGQTVKDTVTSVGTMAGSQWICAIVGLKQGADVHVPGQVSFQSSLET